MIPNQDEFTSQYKEMYNLCRVIYVRAPCLSKDRSGGKTFPLT